MVNLYLLLLRCIHTVLRTKYVRYCVRCSTGRAGREPPRGRAAREHSIFVVNLYTISDQFRFISDIFRFVWFFYKIFIRICSLRRIRSGVDLQNPFVKCQFHYVVPTFSIFLLMYQCIALAIVPSWAGWLLSLPMPMPVPIHPFMGRTRALQRKSRKRARRICSISNFF